MFSIKKLSSVILLLSFFVSPIAQFAHASEQITKSHGGFEQFRSYILKTETTRNNPIISSTDTTEKKTQLTIKPIDENTAQTIVLELLEKTNFTESVPESSLRALSRFNLILPEGTDVYGKFVPACISGSFSRMVFCNEMTHLANYKVLSERQAIVRWLLENPTQLNETLHALEEIKQGENLFLSYFLPVDEVTQKSLDGVYCANGTFNKSNLALGAWEGMRWLGMAPQVLSTFMVDWVLGIQTGSTRGGLELNQAMYQASDAPMLKKIGIACAGFGKMVSYGLKDSAGWLVNLHNPVSKENIFSPEVVQQMNLTTDPQIKQQITMANMNFTLGNVAQWSSNICGDKWKYPVAAGVYTARIALDVWAAYQISTLWSQITQANSIYTHYQTRLMGIRKIISGLTTLTKIARTSGMAEFTSLTNDISQFINSSTNSDLSSLIAKLQTNTFKGNPSFFSMRPRILTAQKLMEEQKECFIDPLKEAALIGLLVSAAKFYIRHQSAGRPVCLAHITNDGQPHIELTNFWNILVDEDKAVLNSIKLGENYANNAIFAGPNGTGKSTNEDGIAQQLFFLQLGGISLSKEAKINVIDSVAVHRDIQGNIGKEQSSFMAQKAAFDIICDDIQNTTSKRMVVFMDEPLNGTIEAAAGRIIYENCKNYLAIQKQALCIIATHAEQPTALEIDTNGAFTNYQVEVVEHSFGDFQRTFKLLPGKPNWWFNDAEKRHRFVEWLSKKESKTTQKNS